MLEKEDENLDKSFQHYLNNQSNENRLIQGYSQRIIENLNVEQNVLFNKKLVPPMYYPPKEQELKSKVTPINWDLNENSIEDETEYENPFRVFKPKIVVQEDRSVSEVPIKRSLRDLLSSQATINMNIEQEEIPTKPLEVLNPNIDDPEPVIVDTIEEELPPPAVETFRPISPKIIIVSPEKGEAAVDITRQVNKKFLSEFYDKNSSESEGQIILSTGDKSSSEEFWK